MAQRIYISNFKSFVNFEMNLSELRSVLLIGKNGSGKSSVGLALEILQKIARGTNRIGQLVKSKDLNQNLKDQPLRIEIEVKIEHRHYKYVLVLELPEGFKELRIKEESLIVESEIVYRREISQVEVTKSQPDTSARFLIDWHLVGLLIIQEKSETDPLFIFRSWLARILILSPQPSRITGESSGETLLPSKDAINVGEWFAGLMAQSPASYSRIDSYLKTIFPDFWDIKNPLIASESRSLQVQFKSGQTPLPLPFADLSDGKSASLYRPSSSPRTKFTGQYFVFGMSPITTYRLMK